MDVSTRRIRLVGLVLAATLSTLVAGCASDPKTPKAKPTPPAITGTPQAPDSGRAGMTGLPLSAYQAGDQDIQKQTQVQMSLAVACMHKAGFTAFTGDNYQGADPPDNATALPAGAWGYLGAETAAAQGFHPPRRGPVKSAPAVVDDSQAYVTARVDCDRQVAEQFKSTDQTGTDLVNRLFAESLQATDQDSRVAATTRTWADCMAKAGYTAGDPNALLQQYRGGPSPSATEIATAKADAECTGRSNLAGVYFAVLAGYQRQQIEQNATALATHQQALKDQNARLAKLLAESLD